MTVSSRSPGIRYVIRRHQGVTPHAVDGTNQRIAQPQPGVHAMPEPAPEFLWFLDTLVTVRVAQQGHDDGFSILESLAPRGDGPPLHVHHDEDEAFHVLDGELRLRVGDEQLTLGAGETALAPRGVP